MTEDLGTFVDHDGRPAVRFVRTYEHPIARIWAAVTEPSELSAWFPSSVTVEPRVGGVIWFSSDPNQPDDAGVVLEWEPPTRFAFTWGGDELHFDLRTVGETTELTLTNVLEARDTASRNAAGWSVCLTELRAHVTGGNAHGPHSDSAPAWEPIYAAYIDAGMPSGAAIPGR